MIATAAMLLGGGSALAASNACKADLNGDLVVNFGDLAVLKSVFCWSSSSCAGYPSLAWIVYFFDGTSYSVQQDGRPLRSGSPWQLVVDSLII